MARLRLPLPNDPDHLREIVARAQAFLDQVENTHTKFHWLLPLAITAVAGEPGPAKEQALARLSLMGDSVAKDFPTLPSVASLLPFVEVPSNPDIKSLARVPRSELALELAKHPRSLDIIETILVVAREAFGKLINDALAKLSALEQERGRAEPSLPPAGSGPSVYEADRQISETLRAVGHRLSTSQLLVEMGRRGLNASESTVKKRLSAMVKDKWLDNDPKARPRGYGLPEWNGSSGSDGS